MPQVKCGHCPVRVNLGHAVYDTEGQGLFGNTPTADEPVTPRCFFCAGTRPAPVSNSVRLNTRCQPWLCVYARREGGAPAEGVSKESFCTGHVHPEVPINHYTDRARAGRKPVSEPQHTWFCKSSVSRLKRSLAASRN